jgi:ABC-2 type transport system permease protein
LGTAVILLAVILVNNFTSDMPPVLARFVNFISLSFHFESFSRGLLDSRDILFFLLTGSLFLFLNAVLLIKRKRS